MPRRLIRHALIHIFFCLCFLLPGGLLWNRVEPHLAGLPFSVFVTTLMLPFLIALNALACLLSCWHHDQSLMKQLAQGANVMSESEIDREQ
jgi:hypothetical protein